MSIWARHESEADMSIGFIVLLTGLAGGMGSYLGQFFSEDLQLNKRVCRVTAAAVLTAVFNFCLFKSLANSEVSKTVLWCWAIHVTISILSVTTGAYWLDPPNESRWKAAIAPLFGYILVCPISIAVFVYLTIV